MYKSLKRILPILIGIVIICSIVWYLFVYDQDFTRDMLLEQARFFEKQGNHSMAAWLYDAAYEQSGRDEIVAIELADQFKEQGNYTKAEVTLANAIADGGSVQLYIALCKTYVEQDKLLDAVTMLDNIADANIHDQIAGLRPAAPTANPEPGYYSEYIPMLVSAAEGALYVTTDGSYPTTTADPSDGNVTLRNGENTIYALAVSDSGLVSPLSIFDYTISGVIEEVTLTDSVIDAAVRDALGFDADAVIYSNDLWAVTALTLPEGVKSFEDLAKMPYLETLSVTGSEAESLEGFGTLSYLQELTVRDCYLSSSDLSVIATLKNLQRLTLSNCGLSGIDNLSGAVTLTWLDLSGNAIRDFSALASMKELTWLDLSSNALEDLEDVGALTSLQTLNVSYNSLTTVESIAACTKLTQLNISNNFITSIVGLESLTALEKLDASFNSVADVTPLSDLTALKELDLSGNALTDISCLSGLNLLETFKFSRNEVTALPQWSADSHLIYIDGSNNQIQNVDVLSGFEQLNYVLMDYNDITSVDSLAVCGNLIKVSIYGCPVKDVSALTERSIIVNYNPLG